WLLYRFQVFGSVTYASTETVLIPAAWASARAGLRAFGSLGLNTIALTPFAIRLRMSASWPAASVLRWITVRLETSPDAFASALAVHTCSSRKPLPTPPPFEYPIVYCLVPADEPPPEPDGDPADVQAADAIAMTASTARDRARTDG